MKSIIISKTDKILKGSIRLPASKSISNRLLMMRALGRNPFIIDNISESADTLLLQKLLETVLAESNLKKVVELDTGNAGTVMRFLTAYLSVTPGKWMLTGSDRMKQRPIGALADVLKHLGANIEYLGKPGYPPLLISGGHLSGHELAIDTGVSSQFTTAMLLIAPGLPEGLVVHLKGNPVSMPYMSMTVQLMQLAGIRVKQGKTRIHVHPGDYNPGDIRVESDWSAAAFWYETAVFATEVDLELLGLSAESFQGDSVLPMIYQNFGIRTEYTAQGIRLTRTGKKADGFYYDFTNFPDIAQAVIATCAGMGIRGRFEGLQSLQIKETDRVRAMKSELGRLGLKVSSSGASDQVVSLELSPGKPVFGDTLCFETYGDHRMAMALAPLAMKAGTVKILNPDVVGKSYPGFWEHMKSAGFDIR